MGAKQVCHFGQQYLAQEFVTNLRRHLGVTEDFKQGFVLAYLVKQPSVPMMEPTRAVEP